MTLDSVIDIIKKILDIGLVWLAIYYILKNIRNNVKLTLLFKVRMGKKIVMMPISRRIITPATLMFIVVIDNFFMLQI